MKLNRWLVDQELTESMPGELSHLEAYHEPGSTFRRVVVIDQTEMKADLVQDMFVRTCGGLSYARTQYSNDLMLED